MSFELETATADASTLRRVAIDPVSRVEGHGKVTLLLDENDVVQQVRLPGVAPSGRVKGA